MLHEGEETPTSNQLLLSEATTIYWMFLINVNEQIRSICDTCAAYLLDKQCSDSTFFLD